MDAVMPELPDVEGFKEVLVKSALHKTIDDVAVNDARILAGCSAKAFAARLRGAKLMAARRHGKYLMASVDRGGWLVLHFGMTGALRFIRKGTEEPHFTRVRFDFVNDGSLAYTNKRMIGRVSLVEDAADFIAQEKLGPDALDPAFDFQAFKTTVAGTRRDAKSVLMDQQIIAGIGNIFSDEILFQARINPSKRMDELSASGLERLFLTMRKVLEAAIVSGAGSEEFIARMPKGSLLPERKKGGQCPRCGSMLKMFKLGGRTAYCCPRCQNC